MSSPTNLLLFRRERFITFWAGWVDNVNNPAYNIRFIPNGFIIFVDFSTGIRKQRNRKRKKKTNANILFLFFNCRSARNDMIKLLITKNKHHNVAGIREWETERTAECEKEGDRIREKERKSTSEFGVRGRENNANKRPQTTRNSAFFSQFTATTNSHGKRILKERVRHTTVPNSMVDAMLTRIGSWNNWHPLHEMNAFLWSSSNSTRIVVRCAMRTEQKCGFLWRFFNTKAEIGRSHTQNDADVHGRRKIFDAFVSNSIPLGLRFSENF